MVTAEQANAEINRLASSVSSRQEADGAWRFCLDAGPLTNSFFIIALRALEMEEERLIGQLADAIRARQEPGGAWKLYHDEPEGNISATVQSYCALLLSGKHKADEPHMAAAKRFIDAQGGTARTDLITKVILAMIGQYRWRNHFMVPIELLLLPPEAPVSFYDFAGYARVHIAPVLLAADRRFISGLPVFQTLPFAGGTAPLEGEQTAGGSPPPELEPQLTEAQRSIKELAAKLIGLPEKLHERARAAGVRFILERLEPNGTLYGYTTSTLLMVFALLAVGYDKRDPVIVRAVAGLKTLMCKLDGHSYLQNFTSTVWDTALLTHALQQARMAEEAVIGKAGRYLLSRQQTAYGDWRIHNPRVAPGGWGFSDVNTINPDVDDTTAVLRAIRRLRKADAKYSHAWGRGLNWVLSMQNADGGWPAFEKNTDNKLLTLLPIENVRAAGIDPSTADLTGRTLEFLGSDAGLTAKLPAVERAVRWLMNHQDEDGSWIGRWGICRIYGTWAALTGLMAVGCPPGHTAVRRAVRWLENVQNTDGGWGESCASDVAGIYVPLGYSTPSQTAWATEALLAAERRPTAAAQRGVRFLLEAGHWQTGDWRLRYPTGAGLPGSMYMAYHSYNIIWPLLALSRYREAAK
ncbi:squalene--hopene cyclase [Paenibacillus thalictri]|uniref:squalene--hopene cyclase n=1 Tax=Paenibacillus thalictri TaxID=2527873 RepID=UPI001F0F7D29|nr:squalene--hopene cyclase [Paenibacillus thalictri]